MLLRTYSIGTAIPTSKTPYQAESSLLGQTTFLTRSYSIGSALPPSKAPDQVESSLPSLLPFRMPSTGTNRAVPHKASYHFLSADLGEKKTEDFWQETRKSFLLKMAAVFLCLQLLFLGNLSYLYGSLWGSNGRVSALNVLWLDLDGGVVGKSVTQAYQALQGPDFPSLEKKSASGDAASQSLAGALEAVRSGSYWAAFVVNPKASSTLANALAGGNAARTYNASNALTYVWNEVRYPPFSDEALMANFETLARRTEQEYLQRHGQAALQQVQQQAANQSNNSSASAAVLQVLFHPIGISGVNIMPTTNPTRLLFNTATMVMPVLQQFFFVLILNGLSDELGVYKHVPSTTTGLLRVVFAVTYTCLSAGAMAGYIWAFRENWAVSGRQFALTWATLWLLHGVHFVVVDSAAAFWPVPAMPFFILTWIVLNLSSSVSPLELNASFYRWGYALPDNEAYALLTDIWSGGAVPVVHRALPILCAWFVVGLGVAAFGHFRRCRRAREQ